MHFFRCKDLISDSRPADSDDVEDSCAHPERHAEKLAVSKHADWELDWSSRDGDYAMLSSTASCIASLVNDPRGWPDLAASCENAPCACHAFAGRTENVAVMHGIELVKNADGVGRAAVIPCTWYVSTVDLRPGAELLVDYGPSFFRELEVVLRAYRHQLELVASLRRARFHLALAACIAAALAIAGFFHFSMR